MSCLPGMPCYDTYRVAFPFANSECCDTPCSTSDKIIYSGPNLACTGIQSQDNLEVALQKIDLRMCSDEFISHIIVGIENNPVLKAYFCQLVSSCPIPDTTTTTSSSSTTTTTTTQTPTTTTTTTISGYTIGESALGGKIAYILQPGDPGYVEGEQHGIVATIANKPMGAKWGCYLTLLTGANGIAIGTGNQNTLDIVAGCSEPGIAAKYCNDLIEGGYSDWYLPSQNELSLLFTNRVLIGGFSNFFYLSSTQGDASAARVVDFGVYTPPGSISNAGKDIVYDVRAIRSF